MNSIKIILLINSIIAMLSALYADEIVFVPQNSLLFSLDKDKNNLRLQAKAQKDFSCEVIKKEKVILPQGNSILVSADAHQLKIPGPVGLFYFPTVNVKEGKNGILTFHVDKIDPLMILGFFIFVTDIAGLAGYFRLKSEKKKYLLPAAAVFLLVVLLYAAMQKSRSLIRFFLLSMGFGFLCLVRINYILFAPLLAFVSYDSFSELWEEKWNYLYAALCGTIGFLIVFIWQLVLNKIQLGSPFVWPHSLHEFAPDRGFVWNVVPYGFEFLCQNNYIYIVLGISSLFFIPDRKIRAFLTLWIFPMLLFFTGYPIVFNSPIRFIFALYPPMLAAAVMNPVWQAAWPVRIKAALVVFCSCLLCRSNIFSPYSLPWNLESLGISVSGFMIIQGVVCLFCCAVIISMRKELRTDYANTISHFRFLILYTAVFFLGSVCIYIAGLLVLAAFIYGLRETFLHVRQIRGNPFNKNVGFSES